MSYGLEKRLAHLERQPQAGYELIAQNRRVVLAMVEEFVRISCQPADEARRFFIGCLPPELVAHLADDWETNPLTLETLRILSQPEGQLDLYERTLEYMARALGLETNEYIEILFLDSRHTLEKHIQLLQLAHRRKLP